MQIKTNPFVTRQTPESPFGHYEGTWEELEKLTLEHMGNARQGYRPGVLLVPVPAKGFFSSMVDITPETPLETHFKARRPDELPYKSITAKGLFKQPALYVDIVLYSHALLAEDGDACSDADYEVISVNPRRTPEEVPMDPETLMRNHLGLAGGTKADYTGDEFAKSILYWSTRCMVSGT